MLAIKDLTMENLYHLTSNVEISQMVVMVFSLKQLFKRWKNQRRNCYEKKSKIKFDFNKYYIHQNGKIYKLWGYVNKKK